MTARLVVSVSGLGDRPLAALARLATELDHRSVPLSLLSTPNRLLAAPAVTDWVRHRLATGDALLLHGFDRPATRSRADHRIRPTWWPAGLAVLPAHETRLRLVAAMAALGNLGLSAPGFAPPGALVPVGTLAVLRRNGFLVCADSRGARDLTTGELIPGRVLRADLASGRAAEPWLCRAAVLGAARTARKGGLVRLHVSAGELDRPGIERALLDAVDIALHHDADARTYLGLVRAQTSVSSPRGTTVTVLPSGASRSNQP